MDNTDPNTNHTPYSSTHTHTHRGLDPDRKKLIACIELQMNANKRKSYEMFMHFAHVNPINMNFGLYGLMVAPIEIEKVRRERPFGWGPPILHALPLFCAFMFAYRSQRNFRQRLYTLTVYGVSYCSLVDGCRIPAVRLWHRCRLSMIQSHTTRCRI